VEEGVFGFALSSGLFTVEHQATKMLPLK